MQEYRNHVAAKLGGSPSFPQITNRPIPRRNSPLLANLLAPGHPVYLLGMLHDHRARKRCFWHALAELRRLKSISKGRLPNPWKRSMMEIAISCDMSQYLEYK